MTESSPLSSIPDVSVDKAAALLRAGGLVAIPTETVYGLAANALDPVAVARIFAAKERPFFDPLIVHIADENWVPRVASHFPDVARRLAQHFWPGPLTMVLPKHESVPDIITSGLPSVGVRVPDHPLTRELLVHLQLPLAAPSANPFGRLSPTTAEHVRQQLSGRIDGILDGGACRVGVESTILQIERDAVTLLRPGGTPVEAIEAVVGPVRLLAAESPERPVAPGLLASHYAPRTPLRLFDELPPEPPWPRSGLLTLKRLAESAAYEVTEVLAPDGDLVAAAAHFFQALHRLDRAGLDGIVAVTFPARELGVALNDRLRRAAHMTPTGSSSESPGTAIGKAK